MFLLTIFYWLSRLLFLRTYPVYYDSFEYSQIAEKIQLSNFSSLISSSHQPIHTFYFLTILFFRKIFFFLPANTTLVLISLFFGYFTLIVWYLLVKKLINPKAAFWAGLFILLFPYFFRVNTNILYESELLFLQISALFFFLKGLKENKFFLVFLAGLSWGLSISLFTGSLIIFPVFFYLAGASPIGERRRAFSLIPFFLLVPLIPLSLDLFFLKDLSIILTKYQFHFGDLVSFQGGILFFLFRILRNIFLQSSAILSLPVVVFLSLFLLVLKFKIITAKDGIPSESGKNLKLYIFWLLPPLLLIQFWHSGLYGRLGLFIIFPVSLLLAENLTKNWQKSLVLLVLLILLVPQLPSQRQVPPLYRFYSLIENEPKEKIAIVTSDSNRFLYQKNNLTIFVLKQTSNLTGAEKFIEENLKEGKIVLIDSTGLYCPYFQFDGDYYQLLSNNKKGIPVIQPLLQKFKLGPFKIDPKNKEVFFERIYL